MHPTKEGQIKNLSELRAKKQARMRLLLMKATKQGQIRAFKRQIYLSEQEIEKEIRDLALISEDLRSLKSEINILT